jgi:hypothetical protein
MELKKQANLQRKGNPSYYRTYEDSPNFYKNIGAIAASGTKLTDLETEFPNTKKFFPITNVQIVNGSSVDIIFYPNQRSSGFVIPNGSSVVFDRRSLAGGVRSWKITNTSSSTAINDGEVEANFWREGITVDRAFEQMHKAFFKFIRKGGY